VIGANVSHQHVPVKKINPDSHPSTKDRTADSFSRSIAKNSGTSPTHARNQNSKSGKERMSSTAEEIARAAFFHDGKYRASLGNFMRTVYQSEKLSFKFDRPVKPSQIERTLKRPAQILSGTK
jgi:hypothetical protein